MHGAPGDAWKGHARGAHRHVRGRAARHGAIEVACLRRRAALHRACRLEGRSRRRNRLAACRPGLEPAARAQHFLCLLVDFPHKVTAGSWATATCSLLSRVQARVRHGGVCEELVPVAGPHGYEGLAKDTGPCTARVATCLQHCLCCRRQTASQTGGRWHRCPAAPRTGQRGCKASARSGGSSLSTLPLRLPAPALSATAL